MGVVRVWEPDRRPKFQSQPFGSFMGLVGRPTPLRGRELPYMVNHRPIQVHPWLGPM